MLVPLIFRENVAYAWSLVSAGAGIYYLFWTTEQVGWRQPFVFNKVQIREMSAYFSRISMITPLMKELRLRYQENFS